MCFDISSHHVSIHPQKLIEQLDDTKLLQVLYLVVQVEILSLILLCPLWIRLIHRVRLFLSVRANLFHQGILISDKTEIFTFDIIWHVFRHKDRQVILATSRAQYALLPCWPIGPSKPGKPISPLGPGIPLAPGRPGNPLSPLSPVGPIFLVKQMKLMEMLYVQI